MTVMGDLTLLDLALAVFIIGCSVVGLYVVTRRQPDPPISARTRHRMNQHLEQEQR